MDVAELWGQPAKNIFLSNEPVNYWAAEAKSVHPSIKVTNAQGYIIKTQQMSFQYSAPCSAPVQKQLLEKLANWKYAPLMLFRETGALPQRRSLTGRSLNRISAQHWEIPARERCQIRCEAKGILRVSGQGCVKQSNSSAGIFNMWMEEKY